MPELPEIETIKNQMQQEIAGLKIKTVDVQLKKVFQGDIANLQGARISGVRRFGKVAIMDLSNGFSVLFHLKMTGQILYARNQADIKTFSAKVLGGVPGRHTHVIFHLSKGELYFNDYRQFGWVKVLPTKDLLTKDKFLEKLGPEFLKDLTFPYFSKVLLSTKKPVKVLLMEQDKMAGAGNIYVNDGLFLAGIAPDRPSNSLTSSEKKKLLKSLETVLKKAIKLQGSSEQAYVTLDGKEGSYHKHFLVYACRGQQCPNSCGAVIKKIKLGGRGTFFCPKCQK